MAAVSRVVVAASGALTAVVLAPMLGPAGWGTYFVAQSLLLLLTLFASLGIEQGITYYVGSRRWDARAAYRSAASAALVAGVAGGALGLVTWAIAPAAFGGLSLWLAAAVVVALPFGLLRLYVSFLALALDRYEAFTLSAALHAVAALALAVPGGVVYGVEGAIVATTLATVGVGLGSALWAHRTLPRGGRTEARQLRRAIGFGVKGYGANALQFLSYRLDIFVLSAVASTATVGHYSLAVAATAVIWLLPGALSEVLFPRVARLHARDDEHVRAMVETKSVRHAALVVGVTTLLLAAALVLLVVPVFGAEFRPAVGLGLILLPGSALIGIASVLAAAVAGRGKPVYALYGALVVTPVTLALYAALIPALHADGAALASTLSYACTFALTVWFYRRVTHCPVRVLFIPTRSELHDLRAVPSAVRARLTGVQR